MTPVAGPEPSLMSLGSPSRGGTLQYCEGGVQTGGGKLKGKSGG